MDQAVKTLVSIGYSNDPVMADHRQSVFHGIAKPYELKEMSAAIRTVMADIT